MSVIINRRDRGHVFIAQSDIRKLGCDARVMLKPTNEDELNKSLEIQASNFPINVLKFSDIPANRMSQILQKINDDIDLYYFGDSETMIFSINLPDNKSATIFEQFDKLIPIIVEKAKSHIPKASRRKFLLALPFLHGEDDFPPKLLQYANKQVKNNDIDIIIVPEDRVSLFHFGKIYFPVGFANSAISHPTLCYKIYEERQ